MGAVNNAQVTVRHSTIRDNSGYEGCQSGSVALDVRYNWWGAAPPVAGEFYGSVLYTPWIITKTFTGGYLALADDIYEPNGTFTQATLAESVNTGLSAFLDPADDVDIYRLEIEEPGALLALADARGTPLALRVNFYDVNETLLATYSGAAGAIVTATQAIAPGVYFVLVTGVGNAATTSSHLPYHLTLTLTDLHANLVADATALAGRTYSLGKYTVNLAPGGHTILNASAPPSLTTPGGYYLLGKLNNVLGQLLAESASSFFVSDNPLALTLHTDYAAYRPGQSVLVTGELYNTGDAASGPQTFTLAQNGATFHTETVSLPAHGVRAFAATTAAPGVTGPFTLTGQLGSVLVTAVIPVAQPEIAATLDAPTLRLAGAGAWEARLNLANQGQAAAALNVDFHGAPHALTLLPGARAVFTRALAFTQTTTLNIAISGDFTETLSQTVIVSAAPQLTLTPADPQHEGDVIIPYTLVNPGTVDLVAQTIFEVGFTHLETRPSASVNQSAPSLQHQGIAWVTPVTVHLSPFAISHSPFAIRTYILPAGGVVTDTLPANLTRGWRTVQATLQVDAAHNPGLFTHGAISAWEQPTAASFSVRRDNDLQLTATGAPTVTVEIANIGWNIFTGTLRVSGQREATFSRTEQRIAVLTGAARVYTAAVDTTGLAPGPYTVTVEAWTDTGALVATAAITGAVQAPDFVVTQLPAQTALPGNQDTLLVFGVENRGAAPDLAAFHLALGDFKDETQQQWIPAGATGRFTFTVYIPLDAPTMDVLGAYNVASPLDPTGDAGQQVFHVDGITLDVTAATDKAMYNEGDAFMFTLHIANAGERATGDMAALVAFNGVTQTQKLALNTGQAQTLTFTGTATFTGDRQIFYGLYGAQTDRGAYLNTHYLYLRQTYATLTLDRQVYTPGATARATLATSLTQGSLTAYVFGIPTTLPVSNGANFTFPIPMEAERGSHPLYYAIHDSGSAIDGREVAVWFDVAAPWARVIESRLGAPPPAAGAPVTAALTIASDAALAIDIWAWLRYPDGNAGARVAFPAQLTATLNNQATISAVITDTQMGLHQLCYYLSPASAGAPDATRAADGCETFDFGPASLLQVTSEQTEYPNGTETLQAVLEVFSPSGGVAQLTLTPDAGPVTHRTVTLLPGFQTPTLTLDGPLPPGARTFTVTLVLAGYHAVDQAAFMYGADLPDLRPGAPAVTGSSGVTRTITALVSNAGQTASAATTAHFYDGATLLGNVAVPSLPAGGAAQLAVVWNNIHEQGGAHILSVVVASVTEWDATNNSAQSAITLPRLDSGLTIAPISLLPGGAVTLTARLRNLQGAAALPAAYTITARSPLGTVVFTCSQSLTLSAGEERLERCVWRSGEHAQSGGYTALLEIQTAFGERALATGTWIISMLPVQREWRLYLPLILRNK